MRARAAFIVIGLFRKRSVDRSVMRVNEDGKQFACLYIPFSERNTDVGRIYEARDENLAIC
jgi:hypothetical protein